MVLGANIGSAINPVLEGTGGDPVKLRLPVGNSSPASSARARAAVPRPDRRHAARGSTPIPAGSRPISTPPSTSPWRRSSSACCRPWRGCSSALLPERPAAGDPAKPLYLDRGRAAIAGRGARQCGARDAAHGRHRREHARRHARTLSTATTATASPRRAAWTTSSTACTRRCSATSPRSRARG